MAKKRERLEVIRDILISIHGRRKIRHAKLLHSSNLSPQMFKSYVFELLRKNFIREEKDGKIKYFVLTEKGTDFLKEYRVIEDIVVNFGL